ncbi:hypothetical protein B0H15DRAFT_794207, partial [Mycena belliarum]
PLRAKEIQGYHHCLLTFLEVPRTCLGKWFALAEFTVWRQAVLRNFVFELPGGLETEIGTHHGIIPRPKVVDRSVPMKAHEGQTRLTDASIFIASAVPSQSSLDAQA